MLMISPEYKCTVHVWGEHGSFDVRDTMTLYDMWTAAAMLAGMCARNGKGGRFEHLGEWVHLVHHRICANA